MRPRAGDRVSRRGTNRTIEGTIVKVRTYPHRYRDSAGSRYKIQVIWDNGNGEPDRLSFAQVNTLTTE